MAKKLETLKYKEFLGGLELPLLQQKVKTPHDEGAIGIASSTSLSDAGEVTSDSCEPDFIAAGRSYETICNYDLPMVHHQPAHVAGQVIPTKNVLVERPNSESPRKRRRQITGISYSWPISQP